MKWAGPVYIGAPGLWPQAISELVSAARAQLARERRPCGHWPGRHSSWPNNNAHAPRRRRRRRPVSLASGPLNVLAGGDRARRPPPQHPPSRDQLDGARARGAPRWLPRDRCKTGLSRARTHAACRPNGLINGPPPAKYPPSSRQMRCRCRGRSRRGRRHFRSALLELKGAQWRLARSCPLWTLGRARARAGRREPVAPPLAQERARGGPSCPGCRPGGELGGEQLLASARSSP